MSEIHNVHARVIGATPAEVSWLVRDLDAIWPRKLAAPPRRLGERVFAVPPMVWHEVERPGATRAFRVVEPSELQAEHWFEVHRLGSGTLVRHVVEGTASGAYAFTWRARIEPLHDRILEALLDNLEKLAAAGDGVETEGGAAA